MRDAYGCKLLGRCWSKWSDAVCSDFQMFYFWQVIHVGPQGKSQSIFCRLFMSGFSGQAHTSGPQIVRASRRGKARGHGNITSTSTAMVKRTAQICPNCWSCISTRRLDHFRVESNSVLKGLRVAHGFGSHARPRQPPLYQPLACRSCLLQQQQQKF